MEMRMLLLALMAPMCLVLAGLTLGSPEILMAGLAFTGLILVAAVLRRMS